MALGDHDQPGKVRKRLLWVPMVTLFILSYAFILQSKFEEPVCEVEDQPGAYALDPEDSYLVSYEDGRYVIYVSGREEVEISHHDAVKLIEAGFSVKER